MYEIEGATFMKTAVLITHSHPPAPADAVELALAPAADGGWRIAARPGERAKHGGLAERIEEAPPGAEGVDLCLVMGGDGSILHALRRFARTGVPVFGINFGTVGFLAAVEREEAEQGIGRAF